jgi:CDP-diacylglycerol--glycerol-3-phosphate 3-phosphatidyltransferase
MPKSNNRRDQAVKKTQRKIDSLWQETVIKILPDWVTPNLLTIIRLIIIPFIILYLLWGLYPVALALFILAALSDTLDGALARTRGQITDWGLILDPLADKLLIIMVALFLLVTYPFKSLLVYIIIFELLILLIAGVKISQKNRKVAPIKASNIWGKSKMVTQVLGFILACLWLAFPWPGLLYASAMIIWLSLVLQIKSILTYI